MRHKSLHSIWILLLIVALYIPSSFSQTPFTMTLANDNVDGTGKIYTVDVMFQSRTGAPIELAALSMGFAYNDAARNGGTVTYGWVAGSSSGLTNTTQIPGTPNGASTTTENSVLLRVIKVAAKSTPGTGNGSLLSNVAPGTRIGRLQMTNTVPWVITGTNHIGWEFIAYPTTVNAYVSGTNTLIGGKGTVYTDSTYFATTLSGPVLPVELTSFQSNVQGRTIVLNWATSTEKNSNRFEVQRSSASSGWVTVSSVKASVLSNSTKEYSYSDNKLQSGKYQYRLKMIDNDGTFSYSKVAEAEVSVPKDFQVSQNYPNPFNPTTKIDYQVPVDARVIMEVYNIAGQKVAEVVNQDQSAGYYTVDFGSSNKLSSGIYIYRLTASDKVTGNNFSSIKKMMLLK